MAALTHLKQKYDKIWMTLLIFLMIPLVAGIAFGYEMGYNKIQLIPTVVADYDHSEFSRTVVEYIQDSETFSIVAYADTNQELESMLASGKAMTGVILPQGLSAGMHRGQGPKIEVLYDGTMMTVASSAKAAMSELLMTVKSGYMKSIYEGKLSAVEAQSMNQIQPMDATYRTLFNPAKNYRNFLLPGMLAALMQVGFAIVGLSESGKGHFSFTESFKKIAGWGVLGALSLVLCLGIQYLFFGLPYCGSVLAGLLLTVLFAVAMTAFGFLIGQLIPDMVFATQLTCALVLPTSILGGNTFPIMAMPPIFHVLGKALPLAYYGDGIRKLCLADIGLSYFTSDFIALALIISAELLFLGCILWIRNRRTYTGVSEL